MNVKKVLNVDMDNVLVDFKSGVARLPQALRTKYDGRLGAARYGAG